MADTVRRADYCYVMLPNRPGEGARALAALKESGVNLLACLGFPAGDGKAQLDLFPEDFAALQKAADSAGLALSERKRGFLIQGEDRAGAVADALRKLGDAAVNVTAVAASSSDGRYGMMLWVAPGDYEKAARSLGA